jgi:hypothetical protein
MEATIAIIEYSDFENAILDGSTTAAKYLEVKETAMETKDKILLEYNGISFTKQIRKSATQS